MTRTPLTYYGGKQKLAAQIVALMPRHVAYLESFAGGAAVLFAKPPSERETLNDVDGQIMRFWGAGRSRADSEFAEWSSPMTTSGHLSGYPMAREQP